MLQVEQRRVVQGGAVVDHSAVGQTEKREGEMSTEEK